MPFKSSIDALYKAQLSPMPKDWLSGPIDEYDIMRERYCSYQEAQAILEEMRAKEIEESLLRAEQEPPIEVVIDTLNRKFAAETLMRVGATEEMIDAGVEAYIDNCNETLVDTLKMAWEAMLKKAANPETGA